MSDLHAVASSMVAKPKGLLAADASNRTMNKRLKAQGLPEDEEVRRRYRELLFTTEYIEDYISGVILYDETIRQNDSAGKPLIETLKEKGMLIGIKVDGGLIDDENSEGERLTQGIDGLSDRLKEYKGMGAVFTKWRAVIEINEPKGLPTSGNIERTAHIFGDYVEICQSEGFVPIIEPEVLINGDHSAERAEEIITQTVGTVFTHLDERGCDLGGTVLKTSMAIAGKDALTAALPVEVAERTVRALNQALPPTVGGVVFLSGGQAPKEASENLQAIAQLGDHPWNITFSYSRALQNPVLDHWNNEDANKEEAQRIFLHRAKMNSLASVGKYDPAIDS